MVGVGMPGRPFLPHGRVQQSTPPLLRGRIGASIKGWHNHSKGPTGCLRYIYLGDVPRVYVGAVSLGTSLDSEVTLKVYWGPAFWGIL